MVIHLEATCLSYNITHSVPDTGEHALPSPQPALNLPTPDELTLAVGYVTLAVQVSINSHPSR